MMARLVDICSPKQWKTIASKDLKDKGYPVYGANGIIGFYDEYNHEEPTIMITCRGATCGTINVSLPKSYINGNAMCLDDLNDSYELEYLYYYLCSYDFSKVISGSAQPQITIQGLEKVLIPDTSINSQKYIVSILKRVDELVNKTMKQLDDLNMLVKSRFIEMFGDPYYNPKGWHQATLNKVCYYIKDGPHKSLQDLGEGNGHPFISVRNIINGKIDFSTAKYISDSDYDEAIRKCHPEKGDILYSKGGTTGIAKLIDIDVEFANWVHVAVLKFDKNKINGVFFENMLNSDYCYTQSQRLTKGIANRDLVLSAMAKIELFVPPIDLQNKFADFVAQVDKSKLAVQQSLNELETLKKSLMQQYFG